MSDSGGRRWVLRDWDWRVCDGAWEDGGLAVGGLFEGRNTLAKQGLGHVM